MTATFQCQECETLIDDALLEALWAEFGADEARNCPNCGSCDLDIAQCQPTTVKRATLFDGVVDTFQTEAELNGWRPSQGRML